MWTPSKLDKEAAAMKRRHAGPPKAQARLDAEQAFRLGFADAQTDTERKFATPAIREHWKRGFKMGRKGLRVTLPKL